ncbi:MAG: LysR family transcriptional regulator [Phycisphaerales bacterium]
MELSAIRYFRVILQERHLTRAAEKLGVTQPALSAMLKKLEAEVGTTLIHRTRRGLQPTEAGVVFGEYCDQAIRAVEAGVQAVREFAGFERGSIRIGGGATATGYLLPPVVREVSRGRPGLRFYIREAGSAAVAEAVLSGELDLGIVTLPVTLARSDELVRIPLVADEMRLVAPKGHRLARPAKGGFRWKELEGEPFVAFEKGTAVRSMIDRAAQAAGVTLNVIMELRSIESIKQMVAEGIGLALVSRFALRNDEGSPCRDGRLSRRLAIVRRRDRTPGVAAAAFERSLIDAVKRYHASDSVSLGENS